MITFCESCGLPFGKRALSRFSICLPCFKNDRGWQLTKADLAHKDTMNALYDAHCERTLLQAQVKRLTAELVRRETGKPPSDLPVDDLLRLVHPDRHPDGLADLANRVTRWVLEYRRSP